MEKEPKVMWKPSFISLAAGGMKLEAAIAHFGVSIATGYKWICLWNNEGVEGLKRKTAGMPPKLSTAELEELKRMLKTKPYWSVKEAMRLVKELFKTNYSDEQIRGILVEKSGINFAKPSVEDYRRPNNAEDIFAERMEDNVENFINLVKGQEICDM